MFLTIFLRPILLGLIFQLLIKPGVWDMNQGRFPIIFDQIMRTRKSGSKFLPRALRLITDKGDVKTHGHNHHLTPVVVFLYLPPMPQLDFGLWARVRQWFCPILSPRSIFLLVSGFPSQITWLPVLWARHPFFLLVSGFPSQNTWLPVLRANDLFFLLVSGFASQNTWLPVPMTSFPVPVTSFPVIWLPLAPPILMVSGFRY